MFSNHARHRCRQRGISGEVVGVLLDFGRRRHRHGAEVCFMDKAARTRARRVMGASAYARIVDRLDSYVVVGEDGLILTAAQRHRRLKFH